MAMTIGVEQVLPFLKPALAAGEAVPVGSLSYLATTTPAGNLLVTLVLLVLR